MDSVGQCAQLWASGQKAASMWVLLAFLAVAAASPSLLHQETSIRPGKEYTYSYTTQVLSGVAVDNIQYAGLKIKANVKLQTKDGRKVTTQLERVEILKLNKELPNHHPADLVPDTEWSPVSRPEKDVITTELVKPFCFTMVPGKLIDLETETDDPYWSVNVKRGLLSFMQLDLMQEERVRVDSDELRILNKLNIATPPNRSSNKAYRVMEEDITGKCESVYSVDDSLSRSRTPSVKVTKVKNFDNCIKRPTWKSSLMENIVFGSEYLEKQVTHWQLEADYEVQGDRSNFLIKGAKLTAKQHFNKVELEKGKLITYTTQMLKLDDIEEVSVPLRSSPSLEKKDSLIMEVPEPIIREREQISQSLSSPEVRAKISKMEELLTKAITETTPYVKENATLVFDKITTLMKEMPVTATESLIEKYCTTTEITPKGEILLSSLVTCSRPDVIPTIVKLLSNSIISDTRGSVMMTKVSMYATSTPNLARDLLQATKTTLPSHAVKTRRYALLTLGSVAYKLTLKMNSPAGRAVRLETVTDRIAEEMNTMLRSARTADEKIWVLKAIGNAGLPECITPIKSIITSTSESTPVKVKAIYALRRIAPIVKSEVQNIVIPIYLDTSLPLEVRVGAFIITMKTEPSLGILKLITQHLKKEPSLNVGSFVYSYLKSTSELKTPVLRNMTTTIKTALKYAKPITPGIQYSKAIIKDVYSEYFESGAISSLEYLNSPRSVLPNTIVYRLDTDVVGFPFGGYELGLEMEGLQTLVKNLLGPKSVIKDILGGRLSLKDILEPIQHPSPSMLLHIRNIMDKISVTERDLQNFAASLYLKAYDMELHNVKFDSSSLESLVQYVLEKVPEYITKLERGIQTKTMSYLPTVEATLTVPTPSGLPLSMNMTCTTVSGVETSTTVENVPSVRDLLSLAGSTRSHRTDKEQDKKKNKHSRTSSTPEMKTSIEIRPTFLMDTNITVGVELALLKTTVAQYTKTYMTYPVSTEVKVELATGKLKTKLHLPEREEEIIKLVVLTTTKYTKKPVTPTTDVITDEKIVEFPTVTRTVHSHKTHSCPYIGVEYEVVTEKSVLTHPSTLLLPILGKKILTVKMKPTSDRPRELILETLYLGPDRSDRSSELVHDILDIEPEDSSSSEEDKDKDDDDSDSWWWSSSSWQWNSRQRERQTERRSSLIPFDPVPTHSSISRPSKRKIISVLKTHGGRGSEKKIQIQLTHIHDEDLKKHQDDLQIIYGPSDSPSEQKKVHIKSDTDLEVIKKWLIDGHRPLSSEKDLLHKIEIHYGPKDYSRKYLDIETKLGRGPPSSPPRVHSPRSSSPPSSAPLEVSVDIDYESLPRSVTSLGKKAKFLLKVLPYMTHSVKVESEDARNPPNKVKLVAELLTNITEIKLLVLTPTETDIIKGLPIPFLPKRDAVCSLSDVGCYNKWTPKDTELWDRSGPKPVESLIKYVTGEKWPGKCEILRDEIETYDKKSLELPETDCEIVLAKDCSSSSHPSFMVTLKKDRKEDTKKTVHIYLPEHKIKIKPKSGWLSNGLEVEVNDKEIRIPERESTSIHKYESDPRSEKICDISKEDEDKVVVSCYKSGVKVKSDGHDISIEPHSSWHGQLCGVCSNYNSEPMDDLTGPRKESYSKPGPFLLSYIISEPTCNIEEIRQRLLSRVPIPLLGASRSECRKEMKTIKAERTVKKVPETCFSVEPVPKCEGACAEPKKIKRSISLHCLPSKESRARQLLEKLKRGEVLSELKEEKANYHKEVSVPEMCLPAGPSVTN